MKSVAIRRPVPATLPTAYPDLSREVDNRAGTSAPAGACRGAGPQLPPGQLPMDTEEGAGGTGAHGILSKGDLLIYACPPSRAIFSINKKTWEVQDVWPTPGNRPHGMTWADASQDQLLDCRFQPRMPSTTTTRPRDRSPKRSR